MSREREVHKEKDFWGNEKEVIYENGEKVGELRLEERGGFFGLGAETVKVEYNTDREEVGYTKQEERGGFLGLGAEEVEVRYNTKDEEEGYSRVEETGGFLGLGTHHVRAEYDTEGNKVSQTNWEKRGDLLGLGGERVRVTRFSANQSTQATSAAGESDDSTLYSSSSDYTSPGEPTKSSNGLPWGAIIVIALIIIALLSQESIWDLVTLSETERNAKHLAEVANKEALKVANENALRLSSEGVVKNLLNTVGLEMKPKIGLCSSNASRCVQIIYLRGEKSDVYGDEVVYRINSDQYNKHTGSYDWPFPNGTQLYYSDYPKGTSICFHGIGWQCSGLPMGGSMERINFSEYQYSARTFHGPKGGVVIVTFVSPNQQ